MHVNGLRNKFSEPDDSVIAVGARLLTPMFADAPDGRDAGVLLRPDRAQAPDTYAALGTADLIYAAGGGIIGHPGGIAAGVAACAQAWDAAIAGVPLAAHAQTHAELRTALEFW